MTSLVARVFLKQGMALQSTAHCRRATNLQIITCGLFCRNSRKQNSTLNPSILNRFYSSDHDVYQKEVLKPELQRTFVMVKPDGVQRGLVGEMLRRFEHKGYKLRALKFIHAPLWVCEEHYVEHRGRAFYPNLIKYIRSGPVVPMVFEGEKVIEAARKLIGETDPANSTPGTIRGDYGLTVARNVIHGSDSIKSAEREISLWFSQEELVQWSPIANEWLYEH